ncbi:hypothetical protein BDR06DRAFT_329328 [Suillus hirtellus]|nr:hypothetical protein BDR06DRAFT_329328 [Suillus hirtellus]
MTRSVFMVAVCLPNSRSTFCILTPDWRHSLRERWGRSRNGTELDLQFVVCNIPSHKRCVHRIPNILLHSQPPEFSRGLLLRFSTVSTRHLHYLSSKNLNEIHPTRFTGYSTPTSWESMLALNRDGLCAVPSAPSGANRVS